MTAIGSTAGSPEGLTAVRPGAPARWQWRMFTKVMPWFEDRLDPLPPEEPRRSSETCIFSLHTPHYVNVRDGLVDVQWLEEVDGSGLERWRSVLGKRSPMDASALKQACIALGVSRPPSRAVWTLPELLRDVVTPNEALLAVDLETVRQRVSAQGCPGERIELDIRYQQWESLSFEHEDPAMVLAALRHLGLEHRPNAGYPIGLKRVLHFRAA